MAKLKLDLDALEVESFGTDTADRARGTVHGNSTISELPCTLDTCHHSCGWSEIDCWTQGCRTDFDTCHDFGSCCPAICQ